MKKIVTLFSCLFLTAVCSYGQMFYVENFEGGSTSGMLASAYSGTGGTWTITSLGTEGTFFNQWYVSCAENGHTTGGCGTGCVAVSSTATLSTLHVGSTLLGDMGASYYTGPAPNSTTDRRAASPTINCTGRYTITMKFYYTMAGQAGIDYATVWYYDGTTWSLLASPPMTPAICPGGQGYWDHYSVALPTSANNNPNVKIGFRWVNNNDGLGDDPSFAVDSVSLTAVPTTTPVPSFTGTPSFTVCQDSCLLLRNTSTGTIDSMRWTCAGASILHPTNDTTTACFSTPGVNTVTLTVWRSGTSYTATHVVTVNPTPHPVITRSGSVLSVSGSYLAYQWVNGFTPIAGATNSSYTFSSTGTYAVGVDSGGCWGYGTYVVSTTNISEINNNVNKYWVANPSHNSINLFSSGTLSETVTVSVYDATGRQVVNAQWEESKNEVQVNCTGCAPGMYIIRLNGKHTAEVLKWVKE